MKLMLIFALIVLLAGSIVGELIVQDPGYVLLSYQNTTIETSLWGLLLVVVVGFALIYLTLQLVQYLLQRRRKIHDWSENRSRHRAENKTLSGLNALSAGNWSKAQRLLSQAAPRSGVSLVNYLAAARAAYEQNQLESCDELLQKAREAAPKAEVAVGIIQVQIDVERGQWQQALKTLVELRQKAPKNSYILKQLVQVYSELKDWGSMVKLLPELRKYQAYPDAQLQQLEQKVYLGHLQKTLDSVSNSTENPVRAKMLMHGWKAVPKTLQNDGDLIGRQVELLLECDDSAQAENFLKDRLNKQWQPELVTQYGVLDGANPAKQFKQAKSWAQQHPADAALQLTLGRLALRNNEWQQAQDFFEKSLELSATTEAYAELARLLQHFGDDSNGSVLQHHLGSLTAGLPDLPQPVLAKTGQPLPE
ncbi:MAG: heme biosynthesis HemY N-terminal domain-containing protein [Motiliproteus sp.]